MTAQRSVTRSCSAHRYSSAVIPPELPQFCRLNGGWEQPLKQGLAVDAPRWVSPWSSPTVDFLSWTGTNGVLPQNTTRLTELLSRYHGSSATGYPKGEKPESQPWTHDMHRRVPRDRFTGVAVCPMWRLK